MARSSGGGSSSGGSRSSSSSRSSSRSGGSSGPRISNTTFLGARRFRYYSAGQPHYIYSDTDLRQIPDAKPRWFLILFYIPFIIAIFIMATDMVSVPVDPLVPSPLALSSVVDEGDVFTDTEEEALEKALRDFTASTGIVTQIVTVDWNEWQKASYYFDEYALSRYYTQFSDESCWLLAYSEADGGMTDWEWEGIMGDDAVEAVEVFVDDFNTAVQSALISSHEPDPETAFVAALYGAIDDFENQSTMFHLDMIFPVIFMAAFIGVHAYIMIFAGTNKKYSNSELEEVPETDGYTEPDSSPASSIFGKRFYCEYCGSTIRETENGRCPNCGAAINRK